MNYLRSINKVRPDQDKTPNNQAITDRSPFLRLPAEIRNEIYRLLLLTQNVLTDVPNSGHTVVRNYNVASEPDEVAIGTIRCRPWRWYTMGYQTSILRVNRQIYCEAWGIFHLENFWTIVRVNKAGFGKDMKDRGFPVATAGSLWSHIRYPVMEVAITFPSLKDQNQNDVLVLVSVHLKQLIRVLWTAKGATEMAVEIHIRPRLTNKAPSKCHLLKPFFRLCSVKKLAILGVSNQKNIDKLTRKITTTDGVDETFEVLMARAKSLQRYIKAQQWENAVTQAKNLAILITDCRIVYGNRLLPTLHGVGYNSASIRLRAAREILAAIAIGITEVTIYLGQYLNAVLFANLALENFACVISFFSFNHDNATCVLPTLISSSTDPLTYINVTKSFILLMRAVAWRGLREESDVLRDVRLARHYLPYSSLASAREAWDFMFGPFPRPLPRCSDPSASSQNSALTNLFACAEEYIINL